MIGSVWDEEDEEEQYADGEEEFGFRREGGGSGLGEVKRLSTIASETEREE